ncbi:MAG: TonB-dependent receptor [Bacteroidetes bacterium]|nr:TonB-dependent receptor [Bacteroidota bacterium]
MRNRAHSSYAGTRRHPVCGFPGVGFLLLCSLWLAWTGSASAQDSLRIRILAEDHGDPLAFASVRATSLVTGQAQWQYTDSLGSCQFRVQLPALLEVQLMGYSPLRDTLHTAGSHTLKLVGSGLQTEALVVTAQSSPVPASLTPLNIRVLDEARIRAQAAPNLSALLSNELNIRLQQDMALGTSLSLQGLNGQNVKILVDGVPLVGRMNGQLDLTQINLADIERVEIVEGPMAVNYGADALGGVINLISKRNAKETRVSGGFNALYESIGTYNADAWATRRWGRHQLRLSLGRNFFDGWNEQGRTHQWKPREQWMGSASYVYTASKTRLSFRSSLFDETLLSRGAPVVSPIQAYAFDERFRTQRQQYDLQWQQTISKRTSWDMLAAASLFNRNRYRYRTNLVNLESRLLDGINAPDTNRFQLGMSRGTLTYRLPEAWEVSLGYEFTMERTIGDRIAQDAPGQEEYAAYAIVQWKPSSRLQLRPGIRYTYHTQYDAPLMPSFNAAYRFSPKAQLKAAWAMGFRAPSLRERFLYFVDINHNIQGNPDLLAETSHNYQLAFQYKHMTQKSAYEVETGLFFNDVSNLITLAVVDMPAALYSYRNIGRLQTAGFRVQSKAIRPRYSLQVGGLLTAQGAPDWRSAGGDAFYWSPELQANFQVKLPWQSLKLALFSKYTGRLLTPMVGENNELTLQFIEDFMTVDVTLSRSFWKERLTLLAGGRNLADVRNLRANMSTGAHSGGGGSIPQAAGRMFIAQLNLTL